MVRKQVTYLNLFGGELIFPGQVYTNLRNGAQNKRNEKIKVIRIERISDLQIILERDILSLALSGKPKKKFEGI